jgi:hypothetical protein
LTIIFVAVALDAAFHFPLIWFFFNYLSNPGKLAS